MLNVTMVWNRISWQSSVSKGREGKIFRYNWLSMVHTWCRLPDTQSYHNFITSEISGHEMDWLCYQILNASTSMRSICPLSHTVSYSVFDFSTEIKKYEYEYRLFFWDHSNGICNCEWAKCKCNLWWNISVVLQIIVVSTVRKMSAIREILLG